MESCAFSYSFPIASSGADLISLSPFLPSFAQSVLGAFLWYQFSTLYFAWHLCPMIVNRICELVAFMFTGGMLPSLVRLLLAQTKKP
jgi:hypothetical protein